MKVNQNVFVVTGAANGIGRQVALLILEKGGYVAGVDIDEKGLKETKELAGMNKERFSIHPTNITNQKEIEKTLLDIKTIYPRIDGLINVAGIIQPFDDIAVLDHKVVERVMNVNFYGTLYMVKAFLPELLERKEAHIVNVSSMGGFIPVPGQSVYGASKAAVKLFTEGLYAELMNTNVHVTLVYPGAIETEIVKNSGAAIPVDPKTSKAKMLSPAKCAKIIVRGMEKNKYRVLAGGDAKFLDFLTRLAPRFTTRLVAKQMANLKNK